MQIPKIYPLAAVCGTYIPHTPNGIKNLIEKDEGGFFARLAHGQRLRMLRIGGRWAVAENDLVEFLRAAGARIDADDASRTPASKPQSQQLQRQPKRATPANPPRRVGRPRSTTPV